MFKPCAPRVNTKLERPSQNLYHLPMDDTPQRTAGPAGWREVLAESEADLAAGRIVPGEAVRRGLRESMARLEAKQLAKRQQKATIPR